jgi:hypothetical protein
MCKGASDNFYTVWSSEAYRVSRSPCLVNEKMRTTLSVLDLKTLLLQLTPENAQTQLAGLRICNEYFWNNTIYGLDLD